MLQVHYPKGFALNNTPPRKLTKHSILTNKLLKKSHPKHGEPPISNISHTKNLLPPTLNRLHHHRIILQGPHHYLMIAPHILQVLRHTLPLLPPDLIQLLEKQQSKTEAEQYTQPLFLSRRDQNRNNLIHRKVVTQSPQSSSS